MIMMIRQSAWGQDIFWTCLLLVSICCLSQVSFVIKFEFLLLSVKINWLSVITRIKFQFSTLEHNLPECSANVLASPDSWLILPAPLCWCRAVWPDKYFPQWKGGEQPLCRKLEIERKYFQTQTNYLHCTAILKADRRGGFSVWSHADFAPRLRGIITITTTTTTLFYG